MAKKIVIYIYIYIIGYDDNDKIVLFLIMLPQLIGYYKIFKSSKAMNFICNNEKLQIFIKNLY